MSSNFDSGNIELVRLDEACEETGDLHEFRLRIRPDEYTKVTDETAHFQWFHFRASGVKGAKCRFVIENAGEASYPQGWENYKTVASYDRREWFRVPSTYYSSSSGELSWDLEAEADSVWFAYFAPYSWERHADVVAELATASDAVARHEVLGTTLEGRPLDVLSFGEGPLQIWVTARQHPGESMAEWCAEGLARRLADGADPVSRRLRSVATVRVLPNVNPDGSVRGYLRVNAAGANLNREWASKTYEPHGDYDAPSLERSPEVYHVLKAMDHFGCDAHVDVHGDEAIEANFVAGTQGVPAWDADLARLLEGFQDALLQHSPDFQVGLGYPVDAPGEANLAIASNAVAERFKALSVTLEMPFKDAAVPLDAPDAAAGWSPKRAAKLGEALVAALLDLAPAVADSRGKALPTVGPPRRKGAKGAKTAVDEAIAVNTRKADSSQSIVELAKLLGTAGDHQVTIILENLAQRPAPPRDVLKNIAKHITKLRKHKNPTIADKAKTLMAAWQK